MAWSLTFIQNFLLLLSLTPVCIRVSLLASIPPVQTTVTLLSDASRFWVWRFPTVYPLIFYHSTKSTSLYFIQCLHGLAKHIWIHEREQKHSRAWTNTSLILHNYLRAYRIRVATSVMSDQDFESRPDSYTIYVDFEIVKPRWLNFTLLLPQFLPSRLHFWAIDLIFSTEQGERRFAKVCAWSVYFVGLLWSTAIMGVLGCGISVCYYVPKVYWQLTKWTRLQDRIFTISTKHDGQPQTLFCYGSPDYGRARSCR